MTNYSTLYAKPLTVQLESHNKDKRWSSWKNIQYTKTNNVKNVNKTSDKFQGAWLSDVGSGDLSEWDEVHKNILYAECGLNGKNKSKSWIPRIFIKDFALSVPSDAKITRIGVISKCRVNRKNSVQSPQITPIGINLRSKDCHSEYRNKSVTFNSDGKSVDVRNKLVGIANVDTSDKNITCEWSGKDVENLKPSDLNKSQFGFKINFKENYNSNSTTLFVDAFAVYVEYCLPVYTVDNIPATEDGVIGLGNKVTHRVHLKRTSGNKAERIFNKIKIPPCFEVYEDECNTTNGTFGRYSAKDYDGIYDSEIVFVNAKNQKGNGTKQNPYRVSRCADVEVKLIDGYGNGIAGKNLQAVAYKSDKIFSVGGQRYTSLTDKGGLANFWWHNQGLWCYTFSFVDDEYKNCEKTFWIYHEDNKTPILSIVEGTKEIYRNSRLTIRISDKYDKDLPHARVGYRFRINGKWGKINYVNSDRDGIADIPITAKKGTKFDIGYWFADFAPSNYRGYLNTTKEQISTGWTVLDEAKQDISIFMNYKTGYKQYNYDKGIEEHLEDNHYHFTRFQSIYIYAKDKNKTHALDNELMKFEIKKIRLDGSYGSVAKQQDYTNDRGIGAFICKYDVGKYELKAIFKNKVEKFIIHIHEPPVYDEYNYMWVTEYPEDEYLDLVLLPKKIGTCGIGVWSQNAGTIPTYNYTITEPMERGDISFRTNYIRRNTNETVDFVLHFKIKPYDDPSFPKVDEDSLLFKLISECTYTKTVNGVSEERKIFETDVNWDNVKWEEIEGDCENKGELIAYTENNERLMRVIPKITTDEFVCYVSLPIKTYAEVGTKCEFKIQYPFYPYEKSHTITVVEQLPYRINLTGVNQNITRKSTELTRANWSGYVLNAKGHRNNYFNFKDGLRAWVDTECIYIGMVKLFRSHMSPTGATTQTLLDRQYKNRVILKKKGDYQDTVDTTIRLRPYQLATIKGLCKLDMPVPVHLANVEAWNPLTVHGWVELYATSDEKEINSNLYEAKLEWRYLTKELYSLLTINRDTQPVHKLKTVSDYNILHESTDAVLDYFNFKGTGTIIDIDENEYAQIFVEKGDTMELQSKEKLYNSCRVTIDWKDLFTCKSNEELDPCHRKFVIYKKDNDNGNMIPVFEYSYLEFTHFLYDNNNPIDTIVNEVGVQSIVYEDNVGRVINNDIIALNFDEDYLTDNSDNTLYTDSTGEPNYYVGSRTTFELHGNLLTVHDAGVSGNEYNLEEVRLDDGEYYLGVELYFENNENRYDMYEDEWFNYLNVKMEVDKNVTDYSPTYAQHIVSPAPIPNKPLSFTRFAEDGMIYYYRYNNGETYKYRGDPYHPYKNGVGVKTFDGVWVFDTNNDWSPLCLTNGLIKVNIHRYTGFIEFFRWSQKQKEYVKTYALWLDMDTVRMNIDKYSDDFVQVSYGDTVWKMWRGRPYVEVTHTKSDFRLHNTLQRIYADNGSGMMDEYNIYNNLNLLSYLNKYNSFDESQIGVGINNLPRNSSKILLGKIASIQNINKVIYTENEADIGSDNPTLIVSTNHTLYITGQLIDKNNKPLVEQVVSVYKYNDALGLWENTKYRGITDDKGNFAIELTRLGEIIQSTSKYKLIYEGTDECKSTETKTFNVTYLGKKADPVLSIEIANTNNNRKNNYGEDTFYLNDIITVKGSLKTPNDVVIPNAPITLYMDTEDKKLTTITTDENGNYSTTLPLQNIETSTGTVLTEINEGYHYIHAKWNGNGNYDADDCSARCIIQDTPIIKIKAISEQVVGGETTFVVSLTNSKGELLAGEIIQYYINTTNESGYGNTLPSGTFEFRSSLINRSSLNSTITINYAGSSIYDAKSLVFNYNVSKVVTALTMSLDTHNIQIKDGYAKCHVKGKLTNIQGIAIPNQIIMVYNDYGKLNFNGTTDNDGNYDIELQFSELDVGTQHIYTVLQDNTGTYSEGHSTSEELTIEEENPKIATAITMTLSDDTLYINDNKVYIDLYLLDSNNMPCVDCKVDFYSYLSDGTEYVCYSDTTDDNGLIIFDLDNADYRLFNPYGTKTIYAKFDGDTNHTPCTNGDLMVNIQAGLGERETQLTLLLDKTEIISGEDTVIATGRLTADSETDSSIKEGVPTEVVDIMYDGDVVMSTITDANGEFSVNIPNDIVGESIKVEAKYKSTGVFKSVKSSSITLKSNPKNAIIVANASKTELMCGEIVKLTFRLTKATHDNSSNLVTTNIPISNAPILVFENDKPYNNKVYYTDTNGVVEVETSYYDIDNHSWKATYNVEYSYTNENGETIYLDKGDNKEYNGTTSNNITLAVKSKVDVELEVKTDKQYVESEEPFIISIYAHKKGQKTIPCKGVCVNINYGSDVQLQTDDDGLIKYTTSIASDSEQEVGIIVKTCTNSNHAYNNYEANPIKVTVTNTQANTLTCEQKGIESGVINSTIKLSGTYRDRNNQAIKSTYLAIKMDNTHIATVKTDINGNYEYYLTTHMTGVLSIEYGVDKVEIATITQNNVGSDVLFQAGNYNYSSYFTFKNTDYITLGGDEAYNITTTGTNKYNIIPIPETTPYDMVAIEYDAYINGVEDLRNLGTGINVNGNSLRGMVLAGTNKMININVTNGDVVKSETDSGAYIPYMWVHVKTNIITLGNKISISTYVTDGNNTTWTYNKYISSGSSVNQEKGIIYNSLYNFNKIKNLKAYKLTENVLIPKTNKPEITEVVLTGAPSLTVGELSDGTLYKIDESSQGYMMLSLNALKGKDNFEITFSLDDLGNDMFGFGEYSKSANSCVYYSLVKIENEVYISNNHLDINTGNISESISGESGGEISGEISLVSLRNFSRGNGYLKVTKYKDNLYMELYDMNNNLLEGFNPLTPIASDDVEFGFVLGNTSEAQGKVSDIVCVQF